MAVEELPLEREWQRSEPLVPPRPPPRPLLLRERLRRVRGHDFCALSVVVERRTLGTEAGELEQGLEQDAVGGSGIGEVASLAYPF